MPKPLPRIRRIERIRPQEQVRNIMELGIEVNPIYSGQRLRFRETYFVSLNKRPLRFLTKLKKPNPQIMVLGAAKGEDLILLDEYLRKGSLIRKKKYPEIDVFSLTKSLTPNSQRVVRKDYSQRVALETVGAYPERYYQLIEAIKGRYDLVMALKGVGEFTDYPERIVFFTSLMLAQNGEAYIDLYTQKFPQRILEMARRQNFLITPERFLSYVKEMFFKLVKSYNVKNKSNLQFDFEVIGDINFSPTVIIKRVR